MSEITNLNVKLQNNPYAGYILPVIAYFNDRTLRTINPFEAVAVANILNNRVRNWNNGGSSQPVYGIGIDKCCCPALTTSGDNCTWCARNPATTGTCCPTCEDEPALSAARLGSPPQFSVPEFLELASADQNLDSPYTPVVRKFETELDGMIMDQPKSWIFMQQMIDVFYENVDVTSPFRIVYGGEYLDVINFIIGGDVRDGFEETGLVISTISDGEPAVPGTRGDTIIQVISTDASIDTKYWIMYTSPTTADCAWMDAGFGSGAPTVSIPGVTITYRQVVINPLGTPDAVIGEIITAFGGIPGYASILQGPSDTVTFKVAVGGLLPASDFTGLTGGTFNWIGSHVPGVDPVPGSDEVTKIDYKYATRVGMVDRYFKMWGAADDGVLVYYQYPDYPVDPASLGVSYTTAVAINLPQSSTLSDAQLINNLTTEAILGTGLFTARGLREKCCDIPIEYDSYGDRIENGSCRPCDNQYAMAYSAVLEADLPDSEGGTSAAGPLNQVNNLVAPDGYDFGGDYKDDRDYANAWNTLVVQRMIEQGRPTYYLKPVSYKGNPCGGVCCCEDTNCKSRGCECRQCGDGGDTTYRFGSIMLRTTHLSVTEDLPFNVPGSSFVIRQDDRCGECLI